MFDDFQSADAINRFIREGESPSICNNVWFFVGISIESHSIFRKGKGSGSEIEMDALMSPLSRFPLPDLAKYVAQLGI
jgi:hypothetical protein